MSVYLIASKSVEELAKVKAGMRGTSGLPYEYLWWFLFALGLIVLISVLITFMRKKKYGGAFRGWASISEPTRITAVFKRAAARQAGCTLEIFDHRHTTVYKGQVFEARPGSHITLELSRLPGQGVDFEGFPAQVHLNFRPGPKEPMEHYQFSTHTLAINFQREKNWRVARVAVAWPKSIISAQRRDFLRVEPLGDYSINMLFKPEPPESSARDLEALLAFAKGSVLDISVGGAQIVFQGAPEFCEGKNYLVSFDLPVAGLDLEPQDVRLHFLMNVLVRDVISFGGGGGAAPAGAARSIVRGNFIGQYKFNEDSGTWQLLDFSSGAPIVLSHWVHAYQRHLLQKEKGLLSTPPDRVNIYPSIPPSRVPSKDEDN